MSSDQNAAAKASAGAALALALGQGGFAGLLAAVFSHLAFGTAALPVMAFIYALGMGSLRGWKEFSGLLGMFGVIVGYFAIYDFVTANSLGLAATIALGIAGA